MYRPMYNHIYNRTLCRRSLHRLSLTLLLAALLHATPAVALDVNEALRISDSYRQSGNTVQVESRVELYKGEELYKQREYRVYMKPGRRSLVLFQSPMEAGQKVLMLEDKFWIVMPKSRRPIRITPMQKLLGDASTGDIATMTWSDAYQPTLISEESEFDGVTAIHLSLKSIQKGTTYDRVELWLTPESFIPIAADLYVKSGKLAKQARYQMGELNGSPAVTRMTLIDRIQKNRRTEVYTTSMTETEIPDKYFNPMYLIRNPIKGY